MKIIDPDVFFLIVFLQGNLNIVKMKKTLEGQWGRMDFSKSHADHWDIHTEKMSIDPSSRHTHILI